MDGEEVGDGKHEMEFCASWFGAQSLYVWQKPP